MGYTHYWEAKNIEPDTFATLATQASKVASIAKKEGLAEVAYECDEADRDPEFSAEMIHLNGKDDEGHETFVLAPGDSGFQFCKTAMKPYDVVVTATLCLLAHHTGTEVSSDGERSDWKPGLALAQQVLPECQIPPNVGR